MLAFNSHKYTCLELITGPTLLGQPQDKLPRALSDLPLLHKAPPHWLELSRLQAFTLEQSLFLLSLSLKC